MTERHYDFGERKARRRKLSKSARLSRAFVWRVVWLRVVGKKKRKAFGTKQAAERFFAIMCSDEPWELFRTPKSADDPWCHCENLTGKPRDPDCGVKHGGGCGLTVKEYIYARRRQLPALEWVRLERRPVGAWEMTVEETQFLPEGRSRREVEDSDEAPYAGDPPLANYVERPGEPAPTIPPPIDIGSGDEEDIPF